MLSVTTSREPVVDSSPLVAAAAHPPSSVGHTSDRAPAALLLDQRTTRLLCSIVGPFGAGFAGPGA